MGVFNFLWKVLVVSGDMERVGLFNNFVKEVQHFVSPLIVSIETSRIFKFHLPGYQYCRPCTKLAQCLQKGDPGINKIDAACKEHDIVYSKYSDSINCAKADKQLAKRAWECVKSNDISLGEKAAVCPVTSLMKANHKIGRGVKKKKVLKKVL